MLLSLLGAMLLQAGTNLYFVELADRMEKELGKPVLVEGARIELRAARHPVLTLDGVEVVPNDVVAQGLEVHRHFILLDRIRATKKPETCKRLRLCVHMD